MSFVLKRTDQGGGYVADMRKSRNGGSYTNSLFIAKLYKTREAAEADQCPGNEVILDIGYNPVLERGAP